MLVKINIVGQTMLFYLSELEAASVMEDGKLIPLTNEDQCLAIHCRGLDLAWALAGGPQSL